jgi:hypothetical protein
MSKKVTSSPASFSAELLSANAAQALDAVNRVGADEQADLVDAWVASGNVAAVATVAAEDDAPSPARKAARRGINVLKSRGIKIPEKTTTARPFAASGKREIEAFFVPFDGRIGTSAITLVSRALGRDNEVVEIHFTDTMGIARVNGGVLSTSKFRDWEAEGRRARGFELAPVPLEWARWKLAQARQQNARSGALMPLEIERFEHLLTPVPEAAPAHPIAQLNLEPAASEARVPGSSSLHFEPEFRPLTVPNQAFQEFLQQVGPRIAALGREPTQEEVGAFLREEMLAATDRFFEPDNRRLLADQMMDAVITVHHRAGAERARDVLAIRQAILDAGLITQPPREIPFLVGFFEKSLAIAAQQSQGRLNIPMPQAPTQAGGPILSSDQFAAIESAKTSPVTEEASDAPPETPAAP